MKPQSQSSKSTIHSEEPPTPPLGRVSANSWRVSEKTVTIDEFIEDQRRHLDSIDLCMLGAFSNRLRDKLKRTNADEYPGLREAVHVIVQVLESPAAQHAKEPLPRWLAETAFAANYFLKGFDLIPDHLPEIGLADDALILQRVIERNQSELHGLLAEYIDVAAGNSRKVALQHRTIKTN